MDKKEKEVYKENEKQEPLTPPDTDTRKWPDDFRGFGSNVHPRKRKKGNKK